MVSPEDLALCESVHAMTAHPMICQLARGTISALQGQWHSKRPREIVVLLAASFYRIQHKMNKIATK